MTEMHREHLEVARDYCLRNLIGQAVGHQIDSEADSYLIEQLNGSYIGDTEQGNVTKCQADGCELFCLTVNERGILRQIGEIGTASCD